VVGRVEIGVGARERALLVGEGDGSSLSGEQLPGVVSVVPGAAQRLQLAAMHLLRSNVKIARFGGGLDFVGHGIPHSVDGVGRLMVPFNRTVQNDLACHAMILRDLALV